MNLQGTTTVSTVNGVAEFNNLGVAGQIGATGVALTFSSPGLVSVSLQMLLVPGIATTLVLTPNSVSSIIKGEFIFVEAVHISLSDACGNAPALASEEVRVLLFINIVSYCLLTYFFRLHQESPQW